MNKSLHCTLALLAMLAAPAAHAADEQFYAGVGLILDGSMTVGYRGALYDNTNHPSKYSLYGGYNLTDHFSIEAGYAHFGKYKFAAPVSVDLNAFHVAAVGRMALGESFSVFGKVGAARHSVDVSVPGASRITGSTRAMLAIGADYRLAKNLSLALELSDYGATRDYGLHLGWRKLEAGLKYQF